jgi:beta-lactam-binding protein with PASTA domain
VKVLPAVDKASLALQPDQKILLGGGVGDMWTVARLAGGNNCLVPRLHGETLAKATVKLKKSRCSRGLVSKVSSKVARGRVVSTFPLAGVHEPGGSPVELVVSRGGR